MNQTLHRKLTGICADVDTTQPIAPFPQRHIQKALMAHFKKIQYSHLYTLFADDPQRGERMLLEAEGIYLDYSKQRVTEETIQLLLQLAEESGLRQCINSMFHGDKINVSEQRSVLHIALRAPKQHVICVDGENVVPLVQAELDKMTGIANQVRSGSWLGYTGKPICNIVNIGIGGSDLGPVMAYQALRFYSQRQLTFRFVSNIDGTDFLESTRDLDPEQTLFIVASKSFKTVETMSNAQAARDWLLNSLQAPAAIARHFIAVSANAAEVAKFGIDEANHLHIWDWVGGRYSLCSAVGLSTMIAIGPTNFRAMLDGFQQMDQHFLTAPLDCNLPVFMGLLAVWNTNFLATQTIAVLPYEQYLQCFPAYLQQLTMESNGKHETSDGVKVNYQTGPIYWGAVGSNGQHSFYQMLHQGTHLIPCDFIGFIEALNPLGQQHELLLANMFAQSEALAFGDNVQQVLDNTAPTRPTSAQTFTGDQPSSTLLMQQLTPHTLGKLIALYEHSVFTQGIIWGINSFDQGGVELGKTLAIQIATQMQAVQADTRKFDSSTRQLIGLCLKAKQGLKSEQSL
ncbi:glucose-6-phosphate isomerase [Methylomonas sp. AM2-LC]|uniref:glucose-6-phosphate isomerase n=1 Tax=Methylomonas sp. AM2-LC TaxID=3153301 RepID=UPI0032669D56